MTAGRPHNHAGAPIEGAPVYSCLHRMMTNHEEPDPAEPGEATGPDAADARSPESVSPEVLKKALKAFRKRLKLTHLNEESKLGGRAMTSGRKSAVVAITPPYQYPREVWEELVRQGKLKPAGSGFYALVEG